MPSTLSCGEQRFWVSNGTKDLLYEVVLEMAKRGNPAAHKRLQEDVAFGFCGVSGMGFELEAFAECFGGRECFKKTVTRHFGVIDEMCAPHEASVRLMKNLFNWIWFLLDGGQCNGPSGEPLDFDDMAERPA
jgi:hypothetical protein